MAEKKAKAWRYLLIMGLVLFPVYIIGPWVYGLTKLIIHVSRAENKNFTEVVNSKYIGTKVRVAPFATFYRMKNYAGWRDKYLHIMVGEPEEKFIEKKHTPLMSSNGVFELTVIEVRYQAHGYGQLDEVCIMKNDHMKNEVFSEDCDQVSYVNAVTDFYETAKAELKSKGSAFISVKKRYNKPKLFRRYFDVNNFEVFKVKNEAELLMLLVDRKDSGSYDYLHAKEPSLFLGRDRPNELQLSYMYVSDQDHRDWNPSRPLAMTFSEYMLSNQIPQDVEDWISSNFKEFFEDRWALRIAAIEMQRLTRDLEIIKGESSEYAFSRYEDLIACLKVFFKSGNSETHFNELITVFKKDVIRASEWDRVLRSNVRMAEGDYTIGKLECNVRPPKAYEGAEIILMNSDDSAVSDTISEQN